MHFLISLSRSLHISSADVMMLEADILMGTLVSDPTETVIPIMAHPPANSSDISVQSFLEQVHAFNANHPDKMKGVKLDFKEIEAVAPSLQSLKAIDTNWPNEIWLNADIVQGPVDNTKEPVDPDQFLDACRRYPRATLSIGWTTSWGGNYSSGAYTQLQVNRMKEVIANNQVPEARSPITFPVRAGIAAQSKFVLQDLMGTFNNTNAVTLTIWSSKGDAVDVDKLRDLIFSVGLDKVYVDVPEDLAEQLRLDDDPNGGLSIHKVTLWLTSLLALLAMLW